MTPLLPRYLSKVDWSVINAQSDCESNLSVFDELAKIGMNNIIPEKSIRVYPKDALWITVKLKELIRLRQAAFHSNKEGRNIKHSETQSIEKESSAKQDTMPRKYRAMVEGS